LFDGIVVQQAHAACAQREDSVWHRTMKRFHDPFWLRVGAAGLER
jgi:hypothetical protein